MTRQIIKIKVSCDGKTVLDAPPLAILGLSGLSADPKHPVTRVLPFASNGWFQVELEYSKEDECEHEWEADCPGDCCQVCKKCRETK